MSHHYHDPADAKRLKEMRTLAPAEYEAWVNLNRIIGRTDGTIPRKYRELIAVGVAVAVQCPYCIEAHARGAKAAGATREEIVEATLVASAIRAGAATMHGTMTLKFLEASADTTAKA